MKNSSASLKTLKREKKNYFVNFLMNEAIKFLLFSWKLRESSFDVRKILVSRKTRKFVSTFAIRFTVSLSSKTRGS